MVDSERLDACILCERRRIEPLDAAFGFVRCGACGHVFDSPRPTQNAIVEHYSRMGQYDDWVQVLGAREQLWRRRIAKLRRHAAPGTLMDVGAGIGQFLALARPYFTEVTGTEVSASAIALAKEKYELTLYPGTIEALDLAAVDNLTLFHVLEHVASPRQTLARCYQLVKPGGRLFLCVPNDICSWTSRLRALKSRLRANGNSPIVGLPRWEATKEIHLSHFTAQSLASGVAAAGFRVLFVGNDPYYAATGWRLALHTANYLTHEALHLPTYQAIWLVGEKPA